MPLEAQLTAAAPPSAPEPQSEEVDEASQARSQRTLKLDEKYVPYSSGSGITSIATLDAALALDSALHASSLA